MRSLHPWARYGVKRWVKHFFTCDLDFVLLEADAPARPGGWQAVQRRFHLAEAPLHLLAQGGVGAEVLGLHPGHQLPAASHQRRQVRSLKTLLGIENRPALPALRFSDEALMRPAGLQGAAGSARGRPTGCRAAPGAADHRAHRPRCVGC